MKLNLTALSVVLIAGVSYGLYQLSYEVQQLEKDLARLDQGIVDNKENIRILKAEWTYQNRPDVLQAMASKYLPLLLIAPYQVASLDALPSVSAPEPTENVPLPRLNPRRHYAPPVDIPKGGIRLATFASRGTPQ
ncbi:MAG: hypothetical protein EP348_12485 [Alphaproteobacteria bacterium]|nr:MAG: hypothetical protein EP348_12485 [Alphaproteobacteria bacterium]